MTREEQIKLEIQEKKSSIYSNWASFGSSLTIIFTIFFAIITYRQTTELKRQEVTINLLNEIRTPDFLDKLKTLKGVLNTLEADPNWEFREKALSKLRVIFEMPNSDFLEIRQQFRDNVFHVFNVYENIALLSDEGVVDQKIMLEFTSAEICRFLELFKKGNGERIMEPYELPKSKSLKKFMEKNNSNCDAIENNQLWAASAEK